MAILFIIAAASAISTIVVVSACMLSSNISQEENMVEVYDAYFEERLTAVSQPLSLN